MPIALSIFLDASPSTFCSQSTERTNCVRASAEPSEVSLSLCHKSDNRCLRLRSSRFLTSLAHFCSASTYRKGMGSPGCSILARWCQFSAFAFTCCSFTQMATRFLLSVRPDYTWFTK
ncbi:unnamed protein product [Amoebophrya sp. A25]|nr:unnamed protein product [Amoebophrya sp. A25]|eukprot:GSA25T00021487001.1